MQEITVTLTDIEYQALQEISGWNCRSPEQELRHMLRVAAEPTFLRDDPELDSVMSPPKTKPGPYRISRITGCMIAIDPENDKVKHEPDGYVQG